MLTRVSNPIIAESFDVAASDADDFADIDEFFATLDERAIHAVDFGEDVGRKTLDAVEFLDHGVRSFVQ